MRVIMKNLVVIRNIKRIKPYTRRSFRKKQKTLYSKEDSEDDEISEDVEVLFMGFKSEIPGEELEDVGYIK